MTEKEKSLLCAYMYNHSVQLEDELRERRQRVRFRVVGSEELVELILLTQRVDDFREFCSDLRALLLSDYHI